MTMAARGDPAAARAGQNVAAPLIIPTHQIRMDCQMAHQHRPWIMNVSGRYVAVLLDLLQGLDQSRFLVVCHCRRKMVPKEIPSRAIPKIVTSRSLPPRSPTFSDGAAKGLDLQAPLNGRKRSGIRRCDKAAGRYRRYTATRIDSAMRCFRASCSTSRHEGSAGTVR